MDCHQCDQGSAGHGWHSCTQVSCRDQLLWPCDQTQTWSQSALLCLNNFTGPHCPGPAAAAFVTDTYRHMATTRGLTSVTPVQQLPRAETLNTDGRAK